MATTTERIIDTNEQIACALIANTHVNHRALALWIANIVSDPTYVGTDPTGEALSRGARVPLAEGDSEPYGIETEDRMQRYDWAVAKLAWAVVNHREGRPYYSDPFRVGSNYVNGYADVLQPTGLAYAIQEYVMARAEIEALTLMAANDR